MSFRPTNISLGFDGGGTKTDCVVLDDEGKIIGRGSASPSNPLRIGFDAAFKELAAAAAQALASGHLRPRQIHSVCAGLAGAGQREVVRKTMIFLAREFPEAFAHVATDAEVALEAAVGPGAGVVLVAGTGSSALGCNAAGEKVRAGGFGPWVGDQGSAYEIGRRAVAEMLRATDQMAPATSLVQMISSALDSAGREQIIQLIARNPDDVFPRLFPVVVAAAEAQDPSAQKILKDAAQGLFTLSITVIRRLGLQTQEFPLFKTGGVFFPSDRRSSGERAGNGLDAALDAAILGAAPKARIARLEISPAVGAARLASRLAGGEPRAKSSGQEAVGGS